MHKPIVVGLINSPLSYNTELRTFSGFASDLKNHGFEVGECPQGLFLCSARTSNIEIFGFHEMKRNRENDVTEYVYKNLSRNLTVRVFNT